MSNLAYQQQPQEAVKPFVQIPLDVVEADISAGAFRLYVVLISYARQFGTCWPSQATLAAKLRVSEKTIRNWLKELEREKLVSTEHRFSERGGGQQSNLYRLEKTVEGKGSKRAATRVRGGKRLPPGRVMPFHQGRKEIADELHEIELQAEKDSATQEEEVEEVEQQKRWQGVEDEIGRKLQNTLLVDLRQTRYSLVGYRFEDGGKVLLVKGIGKPPDRREWAEILKRRLVGLERVEVAKE